MRFVLLLLILFPNSLLAQVMSSEPQLTKSIYFGGGSYYIDELQRQELIEFIKSVPDIKNFTITVHSYTDDIGSPEYNQRLSELRSQAAINELLRLEISSDRIEIHDFGEFNPIYDNSTWEGKIRNRRVDVILWPDYTL
ncbi:MAG: OmpA family protein [Cyclobacteriaceae bacterium]|nr:OmpA family protein [Cyclobacteriaceae bacterium]